MYKCYRLADDSDLKYLINGYAHIGEATMKEKKESIYRDLDSYVSDDGMVDFTSIQDDWFPTVKADIFISHSHKDKEMINALVGWLKTEFHVDVFVDSYIWSYGDDLLRELDEKYCRHSNGTSFDYDKRNFSTTHVHMILSNAINKMIDKTECIIFLETNNSLSLKCDMEVGTSSAWIYSELVATRLIRTRSPERFNESEIEKQFSLNESYSPVFRIRVEHLIKLNANDLYEISKKQLYGQKEYLDQLYTTVR